MINSLLIFFATLALGVRFNLPRNTLVYSASIAATSYAATQWLLVQGATEPESAFVGAFLVAMSSELLARVLKVPSTVLTIPGIIPLVPGGLAYRAVVHLVKSQEVLGVEVGTRAALTAVGIASGLLLASSLSRRVLKPVFQAVVASDPR